MFRQPLFSVLIRVGTGQLPTCRPYEVTNLLWAVKRLRSSQGECLVEEVGGLMSKAATFFEGRAWDGIGGGRVGFFDAGFLDSTSWTHLHSIGALKVLVCLVLELKLFVG